MTRVTASVDETREVAATPAAIWPLIADVATLASLMPRVAEVSAVGDHWRWTMEPLGGAGYTVVPVFTTAVVLQEPDRVELRHVATPGQGGVQAGGQVRLTARARTTEVSFQLAMTLELDVPRLVGPAIRQLLARGVTQLGRDFLDNLDRAATTATEPATPPDTETDE